MKGKIKMVWNKGTSESLKALNQKVLPVLMRRFYNKGLMTVEIQRLAKDILNIICYGSVYNTDILNWKLEQLGWEKNIVDNYIFELILYYLECEGTYSIEPYVEKNNSTMGTHN